MKNCVISPFLVKRITGIEPATQAWEASILPLNYIRIVINIIHIINLN